MYKYDFYLRDYRSKTGHLDLLHHGAYKALLDAYYDSERPLPGGNPTGYFGLCHRLAGAFTTEEQNAVDDVLKAFFTVGNDGCFHNKMADEQIEKYRQFVVSQRKNGVLGGRPPKPNGLRSANPMGNPTGNPNHNPNETLSPTPSSTPKETNPHTPAGGDDKFFSEFWAMYPKRIGKGAAERAWKKIKGDKDKLLDEIGTALGWQCASENWKKENGQYIPNPSTYLNQRRWEDGKEISL